MTDREMLELAAKAAKLPVDQSSNGTGRFITLLDGANWPRSRFEPLVDDGDSLRLAVRLGMLISINSGCQSTGVSCHFGQRIFSIQVPHSPNPGSATRRAIVQVAAMIGEESNAKSD